MPDDDAFELTEFLPYLLNRAAEAASFDFARHYKDRYGMLRTEWRVLVHLGCHDEMTAREIGQRAGVHKTKISRAVRALEDKRFLQRREVETDRRSETLQLTRQGRVAYDTLVDIALDYERNMATRFTAHERKVLQKCLKRLSGIGA